MNEEHFEGFDAVRVTPDSIEAVAARGDRIVALRRRARRTSGGVLAAIVVLAGVLVAQSLESAGPDRDLDVVDESVISTTVPGGSAAALRSPRRYCGTEIEPRSPVGWGAGSGASFELQQMYVVGSELQQMHVGGSPSEDKITADGRRVWPQTLVAVDRDAEGAVRRAAVVWAVPGAGDSGTEGPFAGWTPPPAGFEGDGISGTWVEVEGALLLAWERDGWRFTSRNRGLSEDEAVALASSLRINGITPEWRPEGFTEQSIREDRGAVRIVSTTTIPGFGAAMDALYPEDFPRDDVVEVDIVDPVPVAPADSAATTLEAEAQSDRGTRTDLGGGPVWVQADPSGGLPTVHRVLDGGAVATIIGVPPEKLAEVAGFLHRLRRTEPAQVVHPCHEPAVAGEQFFSEIRAECLDDRHRDEAELVPAAVEGFRLRAVWTEPDTGRPGWRLQRGNSPLFIAVQTGARPESPEPLTLSTPAGEVVVLVEVTRSGPSYYVTDGRGGTAYVDIKGRLETLGVDHSPVDHSPVQMPAFQEALHAAAVGFAGLHRPEAGEDLPRRRSAEECRAIWAQLEQDDNATVPD